MRALLRMRRHIACGELGGVRILSRKTVDFMTSDHLGSITGPAGYGFGLLARYQLP
jgi:hypothetical protein